MLHILFKMIYFNMKNEWRPLSVILDEIINLITSVAKVFLVSNLLEILLSNEFLL